MITPAGKPCPHYYEDFNRGRSLQECRLVQDNPESLPWRPKDCFKCPVPDIVRANASEDMTLKLTIRPALLGFVRQLKVEAWCTRHDQPIADPYTGCPLDSEENEGLRLFREALEKPDD
jgi:hypothetical protein